MRSRWAAPHQRLWRRMLERNGSTPETSPEAGLTLVEVIVALALAALVVAFLAQGAGLVRQFARLGRIASAQDETLAVRDHLRRTVESAVRSGDSTQRDAFAGVPDTAVFTAPGDRLLEAGGPVRITLAAVAEGGRMSLVETRTSVGTPKQANRTRRLVTGAARVQFAYFGASDGVPAWSSEWTDPGSNPALFRIDVGFPAGDARRWPPFVILVPSGGAAHAPPVKAAAAADPAKPRKAD